MPTPNLAKSVRPALGLRPVLALATVLASTGWCGVCASPVPGRASQEPGVTKVDGAAGRLTKFFGFEEETPNPVPDHWVRAQDSRRPSAQSPIAANPTTNSDSDGGFPPINLAELDETTAASGKVSFKLPTRGGSTRASLSSGVIPVFNDADYRVTAKVKTSGLEYAKATVLARFLDANSKPVPGSDRLAPLTLSQGGWREIGVELPGEFETAAYLQIELLVLQPAQQVQGPRVKYASLAQDVSGTAWFDDVAVVQLARISLTTTETSNVIVAPCVPELVATVQDLTGEALIAHITITDDAGRVVDVIDRPVTSARGGIKFHPTPSRFGWFHATLDVMSGTQPVGFTSVDYVYLPALRTLIDKRPGGSPDARRLGVVIDDADPARASTLPDLVSRLGTGAVTVPIWTRELTKENIAERARAMVPLVETIGGDWREITLSLATPPAGALPIEKLDRDDPWAVLREDRKVWWPYLDQFLDRFGQRVRRWQIGEVGSQTAAWRPNLREDLDRLDRQMSTLVSGPILTVASRAEYWVGPGDVTDASRAGAVSTLLPAEFSTAAAAAAVNHWRAAAKASKPELAADLTIVLDSGNAQFGQEAATDDVCRKLLEIWAAAAEKNSRTNDARVRTAIEQPWAWGAGKRGQPSPTATYALWRNMIALLSDRVVVGELPIRPGVRCLILGASQDAPEGTGGMLALWNESAMAGDAVLEAHLGSGAMWLVDKFGNRTKLQDASEQESKSSPGTVVAGGAEGTGVQATQTPSATVKVVAGTSPVFIEGIDVEFARLVASFKVTPEFLASTTQRKDVSVQFDNPWPYPISGQLSIIEPMGSAVSNDGLDRSWKIVPRVHRFSALPGERVSLPVSVAFGGLEEAGRRDFVFSLDITGERRVTAIKIRTPIDIGLRNLKLEVSAALTPRADGPDVVIEAQITNMGDSSTDVELTAFAPKQPRAGAAIGGLLPGHQAIRRFVFPRAALPLRGQRVIVSLTDREGGARLNASVVVP